MEIYKILTISSWIIVFGSINLWMDYLIEVRYRRPDFADEYNFISWRTFFLFFFGVTGPFSLFIMTLGLCFTKDELEWYRRQVPTRKSRRKNRTYSKNKEKKCRLYRKEEHEYNQDGSINFGRSDSYGW